jgi:hypothetical protein
MKPPQHSYSWMHPALEVRDTGKYGLGVFATSPIQAGEIVCVAGGYILTTDDEAWFSGEMADKPVEIEDDFYIGPRSDEDIDLCPHVRINHSCHPNVGINGQILYVAMRSIEPGEEVCLDYAMHSAANPKSELVFTFECRCGSPHCRGVFTEEDWRRSDLQTRYAGFFSWFVQQKIDRLQHGDSDEIGVGITGF